MASSASIISISSIYQSPSLDLLRRSTSLPFSSHFTGLKAPLRLKQAGVSVGVGGSGSSGGSYSFVASAIASPNSSVLSEEAFRGLGNLGRDDLDVVDDDDDSEYEEESEVDLVDGGSDDELALTKLGLPQRLVESLENRGITSLFPIQVSSENYLHLC